MFGEWGGLILQFTVTVVVVLGLIAVVYWLVRRYSAGGLGRIGRGRVPRLAVIDAMAVDGRRKLVLVRRDNVEHLILIGGPSDIVVEQSILRPRLKPPARPAAGAAPAIAAGEVPAELPPQAIENPPIPFPPPRLHQAAPPQPASQPVERPFSPLRRAAQPQTARTEPIQSPVANFEPIPAPASTAPPFEPMAEIAPLFPDAPAVASAGSEAPVGFARYAENGNGQTPFDFASARPANTAQSPFAAPSPPAGEDSSLKVNDIEREMARLLGEITSKRPS